ncbi:MAG: peptidylprolyl isomerase [Bdellovibrionales bacterium]|nr:peptidylprolyl isomerase [Bdellovibrionales bacterium]
MKLFSAFMILILAPSLSLAQVVAKIGNKEITAKELDERHQALSEQMIEVPDKKTLLEDLINFEVGLQEAQKRGLENDPEIKERMQQELYKGFVEKELGPKVAKIDVSENEMKSYYAKYPEIRTSHIMVEVRPDVTAEQKAEAKKRAQEIYDNVKKSNRKFEDLVKIYSDDVMSNKTGGDIGWQTRLTHHPALYRAAVQMRVGQISNIIETPYGYFIVKLTGKKPFADADRSILRLAVQEEKKKAAYDKFIGGLRSKYKIQVNKKI